MALALFGAAALPFWLGLSVPLLSLFISDLILGLNQNSLTLVQWMSFQPFVYGSFILVAIMGYFFLKPMLKSDQLSSTAIGSIGGGFVGSLVFFLVTNFMVWLNPIPVWPSMYTMDLNGLMTCFTAALPFWKSSLMADMVFTPLLFLGFHLATKNVLKERAFSY
jgi:hypothetical protein